LRANSSAPLRATVLVIGLCVPPEIFLSNSISDPGSARNKPLVG
jgi:hypothetical protein